LQRRFGGSPQAIEQQLIFEANRTPSSEIAPAGFRLDGEADIYTPLGQSTEPECGIAARFSFMFWGVFSRTLRSRRRRPSYRLLPADSLCNIPRTIRDAICGASLSREVVGDVQPTLWLLLGAVSLVLLIACVNVASYCSRGRFARARTGHAMALEPAVAGGRQCLTESSVLGISVGRWRRVRSRWCSSVCILWPELTRVEDIHSTGVLLFALGVSILCSLLSDGPALRAPARKLETRSAVVAGA